jgi:hypothetical protein
MVCKMSGKVSVPEDNDSKLARLDHSMHRAGLASAS